ncbi:biotin transporter BioY [Virgibacillus sp. SK37]|uniref:biotin transporter BioY n=1 Tax=Virgibacillus sp. SK37 TaxID=403957 RepID=UPI0004D1F838|nr:biotin transporter BioY [Virgibacillus sp. SK37]AIF42298.1 biotin biosynthesis protein BioC [Virgibacillus sp. SK37]
MNNTKWTSLNLTFGALFVALTAIGANITSIAPFLVVGGVPITLQTFFAVLAGLVLGSRLGAFSMLVYMVLGLAGAPVFAHFKGGISTILSPTFGFILSFILVAYIAGKIIEQKRSYKMYIVSGLIGMTINYILGTNWMYAAYLFWFEAPADLTYSMVWMWMIAPLPKDIIISILAGMFAFRLSKQGITSNKFISNRRIV